MNARAVAAMVSLLFVAARAAAGEPAPLTPADLARAADKASPAVAQVLRELAGTAEADFDRRVLDRVDPLLKSDNPVEGAWAAEQALRAALRVARSRQPDDDARQAELSSRLGQVRVRLLGLLAEPDLKEALRWADVWLPPYGADSAVGDAVQAVWLRHAQALLKDGDTAGARARFERIETTFAQSPQAEPLRKELRGRAEALVKEALALPGGKGVPSLQQALALWPRLPGLRDELEKRKQTYQVLYVAVREMPEYLSPALAWSDAERQAVELVFEGLVAAHHDPKLGTHYQPALAETLTAGTGVRRPLALRRDAYWSDGERFTAGDVRHTAQLLSGPGSPDAAFWRELVEPPELKGNRFQPALVYRQGLLDPWAPLTAKMLPERVRGKPLLRADDVEFAKQPVGTGPYQLQGREGADGRVYVVLRANPQHVRHGAPSPGPLREIRFFVWKQGDADPGQPLPHLVLDVLPGQAAALEKHGYVDRRSRPASRVWFLGFNHRQDAFKNVSVRRALAYAVNRQALVEKHFGANPPGALPQTLNGLFPRGSWANSPAQRVPEELYRPEDARASARKAGKDLGKAEWTLKYPAGDPRLDAAFAELAEQAAKVLAGAGARVTIRPVPLPPRALQAAVRERDFDLVYHHLDLPDTPAALWRLFDPHPGAVGPGGSNFLGYDQDGELQGQLRSALHHRYFPPVVTVMQNTHHHLYTTMPLIPLWQLPYPVAVHPKLRTGDLDALAVFGNVLEWKLTQ